MMKKTLCMILLAGMTFTMAGCGNTQTAASETAAEESASTSIVESEIETESSEIESAAEDSFIAADADESLDEDETSQAEDEEMSAAEEAAATSEAAEESSQSITLCTEPGTELYEPVLQAYHRALNGETVEDNDLGNNTLGLGIFQTTGHCKYDYQSKCVTGIQEEDTISYCFEDLNDDGFEELILKCASTDDYMLKVQIWTNDGENIYQVSPRPLGVTNDHGLILESDCEPHNGVIYGYTFDSQGNLPCDDYFDINSEAEYYNMLHSGEFEVLE